MHAKPSNLPPDDLHRIGLEAAEWLVKRDRGFTAAEQDAYFQWLAADPRHGEWFARHRETWRELDALAQWRPEHSLEPNPDLLAPAKSQRRRARVVWFWSGALTAAAAGFALTFALWQAPGTAEIPAPAPVAPIAAASYERRVLEDGSVVELNRGTRIAVDYTAAERRVRLLQGEALFTVAKNPVRPFIVHAAGVDVRAVGTAFNVRLDADNLEVLVTHGRVQVETPATVAEALAGQIVPTAIPVLEAGESVTVPLAATDAMPQVSRVTEDEMARRLAWQPRLLDFKSVPLADVVAEFNRHGGPRIVIADAQLESLPIVLSFRSDNAEGFVRLLELTAGVKAERVGDTLVLRRAP